MASDNEHRTQTTRRFARELSTVLPLLDARVYEVSGHQDNHERVWVTTKDGADLCITIKQVGEVEGGA